MSCDWLSNGQKLVTASWDHTAKLWDFKTAQVIHSLEGVHMHDNHITKINYNNVREELPFTQMIKLYLAHPQKLNYATDHS